MALKYPDIIIIMYMARGTLKGTHPPHPADAHVPTLCFATSRLGCPTNTQYTLHKLLTYKLHLHNIYIAQIACTKYIAPIACTFSNKIELSSSALDNTVLYIHPEMKKGADISVLFCQGRPNFLEYARIGIGTMSTALSGLQFNTVVIVYG